MRGYSCFPGPLTLTFSHPFCDARSAEETAMNGRGEGTKLKSYERSLSTLPTQRSINESTLTIQPSIMSVALSESMH